MRLAAFAAAALMAAGCGEKEETVPVTPATSTTAEIPEDIEDAGREEVLDASGVPDEKEEFDFTNDTGVQSPAQDATVKVRRFVNALTLRDGEVACNRLAPGALEGIELPREREGCAASLEASIGYEDPRGIPVWESADVEAIVSAKANDGKAKVVATVFTRFADRDEPSVEDDVFYLRRSDGTWLIEKPSLTLYRAIGQEPPLSALG